MKSKKSFDLPDSDIAISTTWEDIKALRRNRINSSMNTEEYIQFLTSLNLPSASHLRSRTESREERPFEL
jgi:hypothetical protein